MLVDLLKFDLVRSLDLSLQIEDHKPGRGRALVDGTKELFVSHRGSVHSWQLRERASGLSGVVEGKGSRTI